MAHIRTTDYLEALLGTLNHARALKEKMFSDPNTQELDLVFQRKVIDSIETVIFYGGYIVDDNNQLVQIRRNASGQIVKQV